jgi:hypothetical protein
MRLVRYSAVVFTVLLFGLLNVPAYAQDFYVNYTVNEKNSLCSNEELWLAFDSEMNLPDDVMILSAEWMNTTLIDYAESAGEGGYNSQSGWFIRDGHPMYPYTFTKFLLYYSPSNAMPVFSFWFTLTCDNGVVSVSMEQP